MISSILPSVGLTLLALLYNLSALDASSSSSLCEQNGRLHVGFYHKTCPNLEKIVRKQVIRESSSDPSVPAALLRLIFHDCQVGGCDGSVLLDVNDPNKNAEFDSLKNFGVRRRELVDQIKAKVEVACPGKVSCADVLALAARDAVFVTGGPHIALPLGRRDTTTIYTRHQADVGLPRNNVNLTIALRVFASENGITPKEVVALLGSHTIGTTHCDGIHDRLYDGTAITPPGFETKFVNHLKRQCPEDESNRFEKEFPLDPTFTKFDTAYFKNVLAGRGLITLDAEIARDPRTRRTTKKFARNRAAFFKAFSSGFLKFSSLNVLTGNNGTIRKVCSVF